MNDQNRTQIILLVVLMIGLAGAVYYSMSSMPSGDGAPNVTLAGLTGADATQSVVQFRSVFEDVEVDVESLMQNVEMVEFQYNDVKVARDPAAPVTDGTGTIFDPPFPPSSGPVSPDSLIFLAERKELTAITYDIESPDDSLAIIDDEVVSVGHEYRETDTADTIILKTIGTDFVVLSIPSEEQEITKELIKEQ